MAHRGLGKQLQSGVVIDGAVVEQNSAVAVVCVFAEADIGGDEQAGLGRLYGPGRFLDDAVRSVAARSPCVLAGGDAKEKHGRNSKIDDLVDFGFQSVNG